MAYRIAVVGATGTVGREMLNILAEREFPADEVVALASSASTGDEIEFGETGRMLKVGNTEHKAAMRSMELMIGEVKPRIEKVLSALIQNAAK